MTAILISPSTVSTLLYAMGNTIPLTGTRKGNISVFAAFMILAVCRPSYCTPLPDAAEVHALIEAFTRYDASLNGGKGYSETSDSASLGWAESLVLDSYIKMFRVTKDTKWIDKLIDHFDRITTGMTDTNRDGYLDWSTQRYSVAVINIHSANENRGLAVITPEQIRIRDQKTALTISTGDYVLEFTGKNEYRVTKLPDGSVQKKDAYLPSSSVQLAPGVHAKVSGQPWIGDKFFLDYHGVEKIAYAVHDGMLLYPVAEFINISKHELSSQTQYSGKADAYLELITRNILPAQEMLWTDIDGRAGAYRSSSSSSEITPNRLLPHNQYLALGRAWLVLSGVSSNPLFLDRATRMARYFKRHLSVTGEAYTWHYSDWIDAGVQKHGAIEDTSHGHIDISFVLEAWKRGVIFSNEDIRRFAGTFLHQMWNGSLSNPKIGSRVNTKSGSSSTWLDWVDLCIVDPVVFDIVWAFYKKSGCPPKYAPAILHALSIVEEVR